MEEDDQIFDPTMKKKKKKKKTVFDPESMGGEEPAPVKEEKVEEDVAPAPKDDVPITDDFEADFSNLKKKKKKKKVDFGDLDDVAPAKEEPVAPAAPEVANEEVDTMTTDFDDLDLKKKKKKKTKKLLLDDDEEPETKGEDEEQSVAPEGHAWKDTDRDYTYEELLVRVFDIMREKNPEMVAGEKRRFVMKPPQISKAGAKKTAFANFAEICKMLHRQPKHLLAFLLAELGTSGSIDGSNSLIIKGRFHQKQLETVLRRYIKEYVTCHTCKSPETILQRDTRLYFLQCETCGSRCSVASIRSGFQAVTSKRAAIRAKTS